MRNSGAFDLQTRLADTDTMSVRTVGNRRRSVARRLLFLGLVLSEGSCSRVSPPLTPSTDTRLSTVAVRVFDMKRMMAFYTEAFAARFRQVETFGITSQFAEVAGLTLKFVPIRESVDCSTFPVHQMGFTLANPEAVRRAIALAIKHGGRLEGEPDLSGGRFHAAIRDPDCNTIELYADQ
jgi:catechol 2,3-dioxygenase-like lactoylglutathione lyase family enzyme